MQCAAEISTFASSRFLLLGGVWRLWTPWDRFAADSSLEEGGFELVVPSLFCSWPDGPREYRLETLSALALNDHATPITS